MSLHCPETLRRYEHYRKKKELIIIKYGAVWCGPCKQITPLLVQLAKENTDIYFLDVDIDNETLLEHPDLNDVRSIPHFKFFLNGEVIKDFVKADSEKLKRYTKRYGKQFRDNVIKEKTTKTISKIELFSTPVIPDNRLYTDYYLDNHENNAQLADDINYLTPKTN